MMKKPTFLSLRAIPQFAEELAISFYNEIAQPVPIPRFAGEESLFCALSNDILTALNTFSVFSKSGDILII
jgi:hypothetical protein